MTKHFRPCCRLSTVQSLHKSVQTILFTKINSSAHLERNVPKRLPELVVCVAVVGVQVGAHSTAEEDRVLGDCCTRQVGRVPAGFWLREVLYR